MDRVWAVQEAATKTLPRISVFQITSRQPIAVDVVSSHNSYNLALNTMQRRNTMRQPVVASCPGSPEPCFFCGYEKLLSTDYQCPVVGIGKPIDNAQLLERPGSTDNAAVLLGFAFGRTR
jgi:hypothetical protein